MTKSYKTHGTCSKQIDITIENGIIEDIVFYGGCNGNLKGISALCKGKKLYDKRASMAERDAKRDIDRAMKSQGR